MAIFFKGTQALYIQPKESEHPSSHNSQRATPAWESPELLVPVLRLLIVGRLLASSILNDQLKQQKIVTLAQMASSLAEGYFCHVFPWLVVKEAFASWVNAPREACRVERKDVWETNSSSTAQTVFPPADITERLPSCWGRGLQDRRGDVWVYSALFKEQRQDAKQKHTQQNRKTAYLVRKHRFLSCKGQTADRSWILDFIS